MHPKPMQPNYCLRVMQPNMNTDKMPALGITSNLVQGFVMTGTFAKHAVLYIAHVWCVLLLVICMEVPALLYNLGTAYI